MKQLKGLLLALLCAAAQTLAAPVPTAPSLTVGDAQRIAIPPCTGVANNVWQINDSIWPLVTLNDGSGVMTMLGDAQPFRYTGPDIFHLNCVGTKQTFNVNGESKTFTVGQTVLASDGVTPQSPYPPNRYNSAGTWVQAGGYAPDGSTLVMLTHNEVHTFSQATAGVICTGSNGSKYMTTTNQGQWNSSGLWTSTDNGKTWIDQGQIAGIRIPPGPPTTNCGIGGAGMSVIVWDPVHSRWLGYGGQTPYVSYATIPVAGTWYGLDPADGTLTNFTVPILPDMPSKPALGVASGLSSAVSASGLIYNTYLKMFVMVYQSSGANSSVSLRFSYDGVNWSPYTASTIVYTAPFKPGSTTSRYWLTYRGIVGSGSSMTCGQDCYLTFMSGSPTQSGNYVDFMVVPIHFN
ncbi:hypothetical protein [Burkholderia dolosa]|uniref:hypothetical protein n=1 Tax=Burkholderia dolosa TaxID=152500 RepID=UPI001C94F5BA|nr:hypothetical protein [Burkholderia dolosa]MBY4830345.1 hypothetical protein [Burkholderia dolosa]